MLLLQFSFVCIHEFLNTYSYQFCARLLEEEFEEEEDGVLAIAHMSL